MEHIKLSSLGGLARAKKLSKKRIMEIASLGGKANMGNKRGPRVAKKEK